MKKKMMAVTAGLLACCTLGAGCQIHRSFSSLVPEQYGAWDNYYVYHGNVRSKTTGEDGEYLVSTPKTSSSNRILPMSKHVSEALKALQALYSSYDGYKPSWKVFGGYKSLTENYIRKSKLYSI